CWYVVRSRPALEFPAAALPDEGIVVAAGLRNNWLLIGSRRQESPARPSRSGVSMNVDFEIGQDMESIAAVRPGNVLLHKRLDGGRTLDGAKSTHPFAILSEEPGICREVARIEEP